MSTIRPNTIESASGQNWEDHVAMSPKHSLHHISHRPASCRWARARRLEAFSDLEPGGSFEARRELVLVDAVDERVSVQIKGVMSPFLKK